MKRFGFRGSGSDFNTLKEEVQILDLACDLCSKNLDRGDGRVLATPGRALNAPG